MSKVAFHARYGMLLIVVGGITTVGMLALTSSGAAAPLLCLLLGVIQVSVPLVVLEEDHFVARAAVLAGSRRVLYRDVQRLVVEDGKLLVHVAAGDMCVIRLSAFSPDMRDRIERELAQRSRRPRESLLS